MINVGKPLATHSNDGTQIRPIAKWHNCLACGCSFLSEGPWNRKCAVCNVRAGVYGRAASMNKTTLSNAAVRSIVEVDADR